MDEITMQWQHWWGVDSEITEDIPKKKKPKKRRMKVNGGAFYDRKQNFSINSKE